MWGNKKILVGILVALVVICVVVGVVFLVVYFVGRSGESGSKFPESMHTPALEEVNELAKTMTIDEAKALYEKTIEEASTESGRAEARVEYGRYLFNNGEMELFVEQFEQVDDELLNSGYDILYYAALRDYYALDGENEISEGYNEKIRIVTENSDYAAGG